MCQAVCQSICSNYKSYSKGNGCGVNDLCLNSGGSTGIYHRVQNTSASFRPSTHWISQTSVYRRCRSLYLITQHYLRLKLEMRVVLRLHGVKKKYRRESNSHLVTTLQQATPSHALARVLTMLVFDTLTLCYVRLV